MRNKKLTELSNEELVKNEKVIKVLTFSFMGMLIALFAITIYSTMKRGFDALTVIPIALLPLLIICLRNWEEHKKEIKARNL